MKKLDATQLRESEPTEEDLKKIKRNPIYIVVDNVLDTYNIGAIFRLADAMAVSGVYLVGETAVPTDEKVGHKIQKASVGTWKWVEWQYAPNVKGAISNIKTQMSQPKADRPLDENVKITRHPGQAKRDPGSIQSDSRLCGNDKNSQFSILNSQLKIIAIEQHEKSIPYTKADYSFPVALIVGHETTGVSDEGLQLADEIVEIPMHGVNKSLNVMVSLAIVLWEIERKVTILNSKYFS